jgi:hypothetical protein
MGITYSAPGRFKAGNVFINTVRGTISNDDKYATGGYAITPADVGLQEIIGILGAFSTGHQAVFVPSSSKIKAMVSGGTETQDNAETLRNATLDLVVLGR